MSELSVFAQANLLIAFVIDLFIAYFGFLVYKKMRGSSLSKVALFSSLSAFAFGLHYMGVALFENIPFLKEISESIEGVAAILLLIAVIYIYKISKEVFVAKYYKYEGKHGKRKS